MTVQEYYRDKNYWNQQSKYYNWVCCQPSVSDKQRQEDLAKREEANQMVKKFAEIEKKALTMYLESGRM